MKHSKILNHGFLLLMTCSALTLSCFGSELPKSPKTLRILNDMDEWRSKKTSEGKDAAKRLNKMGDKAYKQKKYYEAHRYYDNSYPNFPNAYAYIMSGDSLWRSVVQYTVHTTPDKHHCRHSNKDFPDDLELDISQSYEVGIALAVKDDDKTLIKSTLYKQAVESDRCLRKLYDFYKTQAADACVDLNKIQHCLGKPLIK